MSGRLDDFQIFHQRRRQKRSQRPPLEDISNKRPMPSKPESKLQNSRRTESLSILALGGILKKTNFNSPNRQRYQQITHEILGSLHNYNATVSKSNQHIRACVDRFKAKRTDFVGSASGPQNQDLRKLKTGAAVKCDFSNPLGASQSAASGAAKSASCSASAVSNSLRLRETSQFPTFSVQAIKSLSAFLFAVSVVNATHHKTQNVLLMNSGRLQINTGDVLTLGKCHHNYAGTTLPVYITWHVLLNKMDSDFS